jgi:8-oxo-dGTP pyrophosphatase MutT (NUDIX family)
MKQNDISAIATIAEELRALAAFGLNFAQAGSNDQERWEHVLRAAARLAAMAGDQDTGDQDAGDLLSHYYDNYFDVGPIASGEAVVIHEGKLLLVRRTDDGLWALPGGITDPGETLAETARRELWEEAGISGRPGQLLGIFDSRLWQSQKKIHFYHAVFLIETDNPQPRPSPEVSDAAYFAEGELPALSPGHHLRAPFIFRQLRGEVPLPYFDLPESDGC